MSAVADKLREARALIERGWTKGAYTRGGAVCATGAIHTVFADDPCLCNEECEEAERAVAKAALPTDQTDFGRALVRWNDAPERTQAEVLAAFDKAIELASQESAK